MSVAHDYGQVKNTFEILSPSLDRLQPLKLSDFVGDSYTTAELAKKIGQPHVAIDKDETPLSKDFIEQFIVPIVIASDLAVDLFDGNREEARRWVLTPNSYFFGKSPFNACLLGEGKSVIDLLLDRRVCELIKSVEFIKPGRKRLSPEEIAARAPFSPENLVDANQESVHKPLRSKRMSMKARKRI